MFEWSALPGMFIPQFYGLYVVLNIVLHLFFAAGIARDVGQLEKLSQSPRFVPGYIWVLATLIGGVWVALAYWFMHHSSLAK